MFAQMGLALGARHGVFCVGGLNGVVTPAFAGLASVSSTTGCICQRTKAKCVACGAAAALVMSSFLAAQYVEPIVYAACHRPMVQQVT